ncbi:hypothetical protein E2562_035542 [Oryza meyeriana var. granulata]|uniref:Uncharacterized protein n=1 Tax=Oryza meyeriana var. granulata TaxID=110450 RepID=A0A6G1E6X1_9ORYZ|nr:hypothetical protein E2562_035542 [Oryza meyeriana var. granulata]
MSRIAAGRPPATRSALLLSVADGILPPIHHRGPCLWLPLHQAGSPPRRSSSPPASGGTASVPSSPAPPFPPRRRSTPPAFFFLRRPAELPAFGCLSTGLALEDLAPHCPSQSPPPATRSAPTRLSQWHP